MSASFSDILKYIAIAEPLISDAEKIFGPGSGADKKAAVIDAITRSLQAGAPSLELSHPRYATMMGIAVQFVYDELKAWGELPAPPVVAPTTPPAPLPIVPLPPIVIVPPPQTPPPPTPIVSYGTWISGVIPSDSDLKTKGYKPGDWKWVASDPNSTPVAWAVTGSGAPSVPGSGQYASNNMTGAIS
jgi:hypothetical protein